MSTRQAPGSSILPLAQSMNSKKRSSSEAGADIEKSKSSKKPKRDDGTKDKKKRPRRRRRKLSVVTAVEPDIRARSESRSVTVADPAQEEVDVALDNVVDEEAQLLQDPNHAEDVEDTSPRIPYADKGKGKAKQESLPPVLESPESQIARLQQELEVQRLLLRQHQSHLAQVHQALTCQICLDLLHKPFALAPCGHIVCYSCLIRWFTAPEAPGEPHSLQEEISGPPETSHCHKKKKCPICRTHIIDRPVQIWGVKSMVTGIARSGLVELPAPVPSPESEASTSVNDDPWRNIFHRTSRGMFFDVLEPRPPRPPRPGGEGLEEMGMYDADDGGIYRCIDCMHEIWRGICTHCHRVYPGHRASEHEEDEEDEDFDAGGEFRDLLQMFANAPNAYFGNDRAYMDSDSDSEDSVGLVFGEEIDDEDDEDDDEDDGHDLVEIPRTQNLTHPGAPRTLGRLYRNPLDDIFPIGHFEEEGVAHIDEVQEDESGNESNAYEGSFIDDFDMPSSPERSPHPRRGQRRVFVVSEDDDEENSDVEAVVTEGARQFDRATRSRRLASNHGGVQNAITVSDDDEWLSSSRTAGRRTRTIVELSDDSEDENLVEQIDDDDEGDQDDQRAYDDDGSRSGPSSRLLRLMQQSDIDGYEDESIE